MIDRRDFLARVSAVPLALSMGGGVVSETARDEITLFLCGDVMLGRGIDQVLPHSNDPRLHEPVVRDAHQYVDLAEDAHGPIPGEVDFSYVWGDALAELDRIRPDARIINLETAVTTSDAYWPRKGIHYRMHPGNVPCLKAASVDCAVLSNNHTMDWGLEGLHETLRTLEDADIGTAGAGRNQSEARAPTTLTDGDGDRAEEGRVLVFGLGSTTSGIPGAWAAGPGEAGVRVLEDVSPRTVEKVAGEIRNNRREGDLVVVSIHWGPNWGFDIPEKHRTFAHRLIEEGGVDVIHGHSSHHAMGIEVHRGCPILYGSGDFINDYEGITGYEDFRDDLAVMYFPTFDPGEGGLLCFELVPLVIRNFRLQAAPRADVEELGEILDRESRPMGTRVEEGDEGRLMLRWS